MVIAGDFKVELVDAHTKKPFPEHYKDGKTYVEVEPDAEYYISFQRIDTALQKDLIVSCSVDGRGLGWQRAYRLWVHGTDDEACYRGSLNRRLDGLHFTSEEHTLVFAKPKLINTMADSEPSQPVHRSMGKVDFKVYGTADRKKSWRLHYRSPYKSGMAKSKGPTIAATEKGDKKKHVRSSVGEPSVMPNVKDISKFRNNKGKVLQRITLNYCTVPGLMNAGVLSRPSNLYGNYHQTDTKIKNEPIRPLLVKPQRICETVTKTTSDGHEFVSIREPKYYDMFDLSTLEDENHGDNDVKTEFQDNTHSSGTTPDLPLSHPQRNRPIMGTGGFNDVIKTEFQASTHSSGTTPDLPLSHPQRNRAIMGTGGVNDVIKTEFQPNGHSSETIPDLPLSHPNRDRAIMGTREVDEYLHTRSLQPTAPEIKEEHTDKKPRWS